MLTQTDPTHVAMYGYALGSGFVIYSTVPLDYYLTFQGLDPPQTAMDTILGPNTIFTAAAGLASLVVPAMTPAGYVGLALLLLAAGAYVLRRSRAV